MAPRRPRTAPADRPALPAPARRTAAARPARGRRTVPVGVAALVVLLAMGTVLLLFTEHRTSAPTAAAMTAAPTAPAAAAAPPPAAPAVVTPAELARCPATSSACVDLVARKAWLQHDGTVTVGPVPMLPGAETFLRPPGPTSSATPTGSFHVLWKDANAFSSEFDEPMHHAVYFAKGGIAFHEGSLTTSSNGCIHLSAADATTFFDHLRPGDGVTVF
ncbi:L,D-transpeptidase [Actinomycetospora sp. CA-084318]|uniref:L,D-transpeptidase n=1 Tax=Actinomycetospora sp. CA-084318 TaxID=3239892 RepID=UPI003D989EF8